MRERPGGPVPVLTAGPALVGGADDGQVELTLPAGAPCAAASAWRGPETADPMACWMPLAGVTDALLAGHGGPERQERDARSSLEDGLMSAWTCAVCRS
jgi:hypothetical protein